MSNPARRIRSTHGDDARRERLVKNEALFRLVNERMREVARDLGFDAVAEPAEHEEYVCECVRADCVERVTLSEAEYQRVRADSTRFFVAPGHVAPEVERVIEEADRFWVVEKDPGQRELARATDPRAG